MTTYWQWFVRGTGGGPGARSLMSRWLLLHLAVGIGFGFGTDLVLKDAGAGILLPLVSILVGLCFAWAGSAQALLQAKEIEAVSEYAPGGFYAYAYGFLTSILILLVTLGAWAIAGLGLFEKLTAVPHAYSAVRVILFFLASLSMRESWHVVMGAQYLLVMRIEAGRSRPLRSARNG